MSKYSIHEGPEGPLLLAVDDAYRLLRLHFADRPLPLKPGWKADPAALH